MNGSDDHRFEMEHPHHQPTFDVNQGNHRQPEQLPSVLPNSGHRKRKRERDWEERETSVLLECVNLPQFRHRKRNQSYMKWDAIAAEIQRRLALTDSAITGKRCQERMKTLRGYYQKVRSKKKTADVTEDEWRKSNGLALAWWYKAIEDFRGPREGKSISTQNARKSAKTQFAQQFNSLSNSRRSTLLDLSFCADFPGDDSEWDWFYVSGSLSELCGWLSIVQNRREAAIYEDVIELERMRVVSFEFYPDHDGEDILKPRIEFSRLRVYKEFFEKVLDRYPAYDTRRRVLDKIMVTFDSSCAPLGITVLHLQVCVELEEVDLSGFRMLRSLFIGWCGKLREVIGWECLEALGWLEILCCPSYNGYPPLQKIPSLQEFRFNPGDNSSTSSGVLPGGELDLSGCVRLRTLEIFRDDALSSILGLEGLRSLTALRIYSCAALENLPDIGHLKDLTHLTISATSVEEIKGVEKLWSLKELDCVSSKLKTLPDLSHLPHLQSVNLLLCPVASDPSIPYHKSSGEFWNDYLDVSDVSDGESDCS